MKQDNEGKTGEKDLDTPSTGGEVDKEASAGERGLSNDSKEAKTVHSMITTPVNHIVEQRVLLDSIPRCLPSPEDKNTRDATWTWDEKGDCDLPAVFVCHHCHAPVCDRHSYWVPDPWFPVVREGKHARDPAADAKKQKLGNLLTTLAFLSVVAGSVLVTIAGIFFSLATTSWYYRVYYNAIGTGFLVPGLISLACAVVFFILGNRYKKVTTRAIAPYPRYVRVESTKFGLDIPRYFEHVGFFNAVHCWPCLVKEHPGFIAVAKDVLNEVVAKAAAWQSRQAEKWTDRDLASIGTWAANRFLQGFKFEGTSWPMPTPGTYPLRLMIPHGPPDAKVKREGAVRAWFFENRP